MPTIAAASAQQQQPHIVVELPPWLQPSMPGMGLIGHASTAWGGRRVARDAHSWSNGLLEFSDACVYLGVLACPCTVLYDVYGKAVGPEAKVVHHNDPTLTAAACLLSGCLCIPCGVATSQVGFRVLDKAVDMYQGDDDDDSVTSAMVRWLRGSPEWMHDGEGYDVDPHESEDWWPLRWCTHHTKDLLYAVCECRACCCGAPRLPLCYVCAVGLLYPCLVCPATLLLRLYVIETYDIHEPCCVAAATALCCTPCALVQMNREVSAYASSQSAALAETREPFMPASMMLH
jgi:hypothetical protein